MLLVMVLVISLLMIGCGGDPKVSSPDGGEKERLVLADITWDSVKVHNRILGFILQHGYGYPEPEYKFGETLPLLQGLIQGGIDITMEVWVDNYQEAWSEALKGGTVKDMGIVYPDAPQGWYVPTYMIKGDPERGIEPVAPELKSVTDLPRYWKLFQDPEVPTKGRFHNSPPGWAVTEINESKIKAYGLDKTFNIFSTGSDAALSASMVSAYEKGEPWVGYNWEPNWVMGQLDMTMLEEPPYDPVVWEEDQGCAFPAATVLKAVHVDLETTAPEVVEIVAKYQTTLQQNNDFLAYMSENDADEEEAAIYFLKKYPDTWKSWIPEDVALKVENALKEV
ncbi:MAG: ABC transporter substrate-binding protein [Syntrophomonadaceae bacterium]|jgi:glycine betaine/proline transport system substrate-binding protein|nr:ABC transporter substrate-binding protein [Syntrophomonadaceae bacterium]